MSDTQKWQLLALSVLLALLLWLLAPVLTPFALSALLAYLADPLVDRLERWKLSRTAAVAIVFSLMTLLIVGIVLLLIPMLERQITAFIEQLPRYINYIQERALPWVERTTGFSVEAMDPAQIMEVLREHWQQAGGVAATVLGGISKSGIAVLGWVANLLLIPVVTFYLLRDWDVLIQRLRELLPRAVEPTVSRLAAESDSVLGGFLRGQVSVMLALGTLYSIGLWMVGIDLALLIGMLAGLVSFVPYLGVFVGAAVGIIAALVQYGDWFHPLMVVAVFAVGQTLEGFVLTPWLVGDRIGLHPVAVIFAIMAGGQLFGFLGVLLALPVAAVAMVLLRYLYERYTASRLYGAEGAPGAIEPSVMSERAPEAESDSALAAAAAMGEAAQVRPELAPIRTEPSPPA